MDLAGCSAHDLIAIMGGPLGMGHVWADRDVSVFRKRHTGVDALRHPRAYQYRDDMDRYVANVGRLFHIFFRRPPAGKASQMGR